MEFLRPSSNSVFKCHSPKGIKLITRLRLGLSHLREHKFRHNFQDTLNSICSCGDDIETRVHYLLHYPNYFDERRTLLNNFQSIGENISNNDASNTRILNATIQYILATEDLTSLLLALESFSHFSIHILTLLSPAIVHTRLNDKWLFVSFFFYCHHCFSLVFCYLVLFFIKWLNSDF